MVILDVVGEEIACVEVLRPERGSRSYFRCFLEIPFAYLSAYRHSPQDSALGLVTPYNTHAA